MTESFKGSSISCIQGSLRTARSCSRLSNFTQHAQVQWVELQLMLLPSCATIFLGGSTGQRRLRALTVPCIDTMPLSMLYLIFNNPSIHILLLVHQCSFVAIPFRHEITASGHTFPTRPWVAPSPLLHYLQCVPYCHDWSHGGSVFAPSWTGRALAFLAFLSSFLLMLPLFIPTPPWLPILSI
jgi:hypothetical protein